MDEQARTLPPARRPAVARLLEVALRQLGTQVVFLSSVAGGARTVAATAGEHPSIRPGWSDPVDDTYCQRILDGQLPEVIPDTRADARTAGLAATTVLAIGCYVGVPVALPDGSLYGTLCALSPLPDPDLGRPDVRVLRVIAHAIGELLAHPDADDHHDVLAEPIRDLLDAGDPVIVLQPIVQLADSSVVAAEALSRFPSDPELTPAEVFVLAEAAGMGLELELRALARACEVLDDVALPVGLNGSPLLWRTEEALALLAAAPADRTVVEITERLAVENYPDLLAGLAPHRGRGGRLAVDDVGAGHAGLQHLLALKPDLLKLDATL
ncbi:MAG: sensor domain-containing phosphodiesterase, partial [Mycobacteriales bacterium]